jgi:uncharacterized protein
MEVAMNDKDRTELEAAAFRRLMEHLRGRSDVQNIDLMNLAGFCRNCLSNWLEDAAKDRGVALSKAEARHHVYGMPYDAWKATHQTDASAAQTQAFDKQSKHQH